MARSISYAASETRATINFDAALREEAGKHPRAGSRMLSAYLKRRGIAQAGRTRVSTAMQHLDIVHIPKRRVVRTTNSRHGFERYPNLVLHRAAETTDEIWVADITYIRLGNGFVYLAVIMDMYTRVIRGWALEATMEQSLTLAALEMALKHHTPRIHHSDHGVQYAALAYTERLKKTGSAISMAGIGEPTENGYAERLMRTIKEEEVSLTEYDDIDDARAHIGPFLTDVYNTKRPHSSLNYLTPEEFQALAALAEPITFVK
ncbi:MAG: IS3 family transposase [Candidatus Kapaibacterium sp.]|nr:MAG: IS3 family transposase [Candidatus Kapabacteria bacterium]